MRSAYPGAIVQCPVDFLAPLVLAAPRQARAVLRMLAGWGISRFSVAWGRDSTRSLVRQLEEWGYEVNLYAVPDHESFLQAMLLLPRSLTADFNFPEWNYYGRGSGERRRYHRYPKRQSTAAADDAEPRAAAVTERRFQDRSTEGVPEGHERAVAARAAARAMSTGYSGIAAVGGSEFVA